MRPVAALFLLGIITSVHAEDGQNPSTLTERSQASARAVLDRAVNELGGAAALRSIETVRYRFEGQTWVRLEAPTPEPPYEAGTQEETVLLDLRNNRLRIDQRDSMAAYETDNTYVVGRGTATNYNHRSRAVVPMSMAQANGQFASYYRRLPQLLLRQALDNVDTLRHLGRDDFAGRPHEVISFITSQAEQLTVYVDAASNLISKCELLYFDVVTGDDAAEFLFGDYTGVGAQRVPLTWTERQAGTTVASLRVRAEFDPKVTDASFEVPHEGYASVEMPVIEEEIEKLAEGVFVMRNVAARNQNAMAVEFKDYILVVEAAPAARTGADKLIARIKETIPGKPIRYVAFTHHHADHFGGLRSFIAEGATVITTDGNRELVNAMVRGRHFDRLSAQPRAPEFLIIKGKHVLSDGNRKVELIDIGPSPHARELVIAYLPRERIVFEADLFTMPYTKRPLGPPLAHTKEFAERVRELGLKVDRIIGAHGRTATAADFSALTGLEL